MATSPVVTTVSGVSFTVNTTPANLDSDLTIRDFLVLENGVLTVNPLSYTKTTATSVQYSGPAVPVSTSLELRRNTPRGIIQLQTPRTKVRSTDWNREFDRRVRIQEEIDLYGAGGGFSVRLPVDTAYDSTWNGDTLFSPTRNALYDKIETLAPINNPTFTGVVTLPAGLLVSDNSLKAATTAYVQSNLVTFAPLASPAFTGNPTAATQVVSDNSTRLATTAFVKSQAYAPLASPTFTGSVTIPTVSTADNSTLAASTAYVKSQLVNTPLTGVPTAPTAANGTATTQLATTQFVQRLCRPCLIATRTTALAIATSVENPIPWNNAIRDVDAILNTTTGVITLPRAGFYDVHCLAYYAGTSTFGSLSVIDGGTLTRLVRMDFRGNTASAIPLAGSAVFYAASPGVQIRIAISDIGVAGNLSPEATVSSRNFNHLTVTYLGNDA